MRAPGSLRRDIFTALHPRFGGSAWSSPGGGSTAYRTRGGLGRLALFPVFGPGCDGSTDSGVDVQRNKVRFPFHEIRNPLLEELQALQDALEASEERRDSLETTLDDLLEKVPPTALERLPEDLLRRIFARLPQQVQDTLQARLFPPNDRRRGRDA